MSGGREAVGQGGEGGKGGGGSPEWKGEEEKGSPKGRAGGAEPWEKKAGKGESGGM